MKVIPGAPDSATGCAKKGHETVGNEVESHRGEYER